MDLQRLLGLSRKVAWAWPHRIREAMLAPCRGPPAGTIQVDETMVGTSEEGVFGRDRGSQKHLVIGAVEEREAACDWTRLAPLGRASRKALQLRSSGTVAEEPQVRTDGFAGYDVLEHAYEHDVHVIGNPKTASEKLPHVHRFFSLINRLILSTCQGSVSSRYMEPYRNDRVFRFNRRTSKSLTLLLQRILENGARSQAGVHVPVHRDDITGLLTAWTEEHEAWSRRDLKDAESVSVWSDGIDSNVRLEDDRQCILALMGATKDGHKEPVSVLEGYRESEQS